MPIEILQRNWDHILQQVEAAMDTSGRKPGEVKIIAVTKKQQAAVIEEALTCGIQVFGENYPQEAREKIALVKSLGLSAEWHMIGHLQSRKAKIVADDFACVHSIDSVHAAAALEKELTARARTLPCLLEFNLTGEESKSGFPGWNSEQMEHSFQEIELLKTYSSVDIVGLMTMPPLTTNPEESRPVYQKLVQLREKIQKRFPNYSWNELSMGTSFDYRIAVEEGATMVRIGQALFGERHL